MQRSLNLGILAHVDAGKTSLTEQILYNAGVIRDVGSVDKGTAQTDTMELERQRGISIQSAITAFRIGDLNINLIDTPGHADFIAEVERAIGVLDAVILVISAVEGVQPQTRRLSRAIASLGLPCLIFVNKIDRTGARFRGLIKEIDRELQRDLVVLTSVTDGGTRHAAVHSRDLCLPETIEELVDALSRHDDALLERFVEDEGGLCVADVMDSLRMHVAGGRVTPVFHGSAMTGVGVDALFWGIAELLPPSRQANDEPVAAEIFKVQRLARGERVVLGRVWSGKLENRSVVPIVRPHGGDEKAIEPAKITGIDGFRDGTVEQWQQATAGDIVRVHGLPDARIGDWLGETIRERVPAFEPPVFESRIEPVHPEDKVRLNAALVELVDQDPLIAVRRDPMSGETYVRLYGEVQQEVIQATLSGDYGVAATFGVPTVVFVERLKGVGRAAEVYPDTKPPFYATVGFRIGPKRGKRSTWTFTPGKAKQG
ncbi:MAG TPA: translation factor GTPase family protein, partial [Thermomicrobiales bacterium]|nr:translation factor GTPase family protein [Thermomicrobiales bacterium]